MLHLTAHSKIWLANRPVDFRKQIDGLVAICQQQYQHNPRDGALYVFINRSRTMLKVLCYEHNGYWLGLKRLSRGKFKSWPIRQDAMNAVAAQKLRALLHDIVVKKTTMV